MVIWTTTPWTLPANQAVALHPDFDYVVVQVNGEQGEERAAAGRRSARSGIGALRLRAKHRVLARCKGAALEGLRVRHPFHDRGVPLILGDHVTLDAGTGAVHTAPGHGQEDYIVGQRYGLNVDNPVGRRRPLPPRDRVLRRRERVRGQRSHHRGTARTAAPCCMPKSCATATRTAGATRRRSSSAPRRSGSSAWTSWVCARRRWTPSARSSSRPTGAASACTAWSPTAPTGASRASATGACRWRCSCTARPASCTRRRRA